MTTLEELARILVCPRCHSSLEYRAAEPSFVCARCAVRYPVRDGIPVMLIDEATPL